MLRSFKQLLGFSIRATDGRAGTIGDLYFDDSSWRLRYCVMDSGRWLTGRYLLIPSRRLSVLDSSHRELWVRLSKAEVGRSPAAATDKPVSKRRHAPEDCHLRSCTAVLGHRLAAVDGPIGRVDDFLIDDKGWAIQHLIVDTRDHVSSGPHVLVAPRHIDSISWPRALVSVDMTRAAVVTAPIYQTAGAIGPSPDAA